MKRFRAGRWATALAAVIGLVGLEPGLARASVVTSGCANDGVACTLDELLFEGASITVNDKLFSGWALEQDFSTEFVDFTLIDVFGLDDGGLDPGPGLSFEANAGALSVADGDSIDFSFNFGVQDAGGFIVDNSLELVDFVVTGFGFIDISETVFDANGINLADKFVTSDPFFGETFALAAFDPQTSLIIEKDILVYTFFGDSADLLVFEQRFSQVGVVPLPGALVLFGSGLAGLALLRRRQRRKTVNAA